MSRYILRETTINLGWEKEIGTNNRPQGRVDIDAEISKAQAKLKKATDGAQRQRKILNDPAYQQKVSKELQEVEQKKLADFEAEAQNYEVTIEHFEKLKLE